MGQSNDRTVIDGEQEAETGSGERFPGSKGEHRLQEEFGTSTRARAFYTHQVLNHLNVRMREFVSRQELMFVASSDRNGEADSSFRAGHPGFVKVLDERTVAYPEYRGNGVMASLGNFSENPHVGLLFLDFTDQIGLHINGCARIVENGAFLRILKDHPAEQAVLGDEVLKDIIESDGGHLERWIMVSVVEAYVQCSKHIPPMRRMDHNIQWGEETGHHVHGGDYFRTAHGEK
jgi:uncharacterized protein